MDLNEFDAYYLNNLLDTLWKENKTVFLRDILINKLRVNILTSCVYCTNCQLLFAEELWVTVYCTSYEFFYCKNYELRFAYVLRVIFYMRVTSYFLTMSYNKDKDDKAVYDNKIMIKNYSLGLFFDKELGAC